jgi:hypothetical protein
MYVFVFGSVFHIWEKRPLCFWLTSLNMISRSLVPSIYLQKTKFLSFFFFFFFFIFFIFFYFFFFFFFFSLFLFFFFFFCRGLGFELSVLTLARQALLLLQPLCEPFFMMGFFFEMGSYELFAWGWLQTVILLIFASCTARIIGVASHWHLAHSSLLLNNIWFYIYHIFLISSSGLFPWLGYYI